MLQYSVFFQICRAQYIGYNLKERRGILFTPMDSYKREYLGMMAVAESLEKAMQLFVRSLQLIHREISTPNMPGSNNFQVSYHLSDLLNHKSGQQKDVHCEVQAFRLFSPFGYIKHSVICLKRVASKQ
ncbi:hypothetical protein P879_11399 [Paragonimus westermani]|uniref:Uncharacterized protein n=1 Tax=Paragonimus westermani TaxID=34504 RepID=A0A8T0D6S8_9TREM|nr:hypothetical protein P879_11399 [Paragonimus westermani]